MLETWTELEVRYAETDRMGIVHHSVYPVYFEVGRTDFFKEHFIPYQELEKHGILAPVLQLELKIYGRLTYGDRARLLTYPLRLKGVRLSMGYQIYNQDTGEMVAEGDTLHALVGKDLRPQHPRHFQAIYDEIVKVFTEPG